MREIDEMNRERFEELVNRIRGLHDAAGIAVAVVDAAGETRYEQYFGFRDKEKELPIDQDTIFGIASLTKSFVALSIMQLCERGLVELDAPVSRYLPEFTNRNQETVTVAHFLSHSGGFYPVHRTVVAEIAEKLGISEETEGDLAYSERLALAGTEAVAAQLDAQTAEDGLIGKPGQYMSYCNDGFGLLSEIVRRRGGEASFAEYVKKHILEPLGMERSGADYLRPRLDSNVNRLYKKRDGVMCGTLDFYENAFVLGGAGSMKSTISDMKKYVRMYLNGGKGPDGVRLLSHEGIRTMCRPRIEYQPGSWYCLGLSVKELDGLRVVEHSGSLPGVSSRMAWSYGAGLGVIVLCNTSDVPAGVISDAALRLCCGQDPTKMRETYQECVWTKEEREAALGVYRSGEGVVVEVFQAGEGVQVRIGGQDVPFIPVQKRLGLIRQPAQDQTLEFFADENGKIFAVGWGGRMVPREKKNGQ